MKTVAQQRSRIYRIAILAAGVFVHLMVCWAMLSLGFMSIEPLKFLGLSSLAGAGFVFFLLTVTMEWNLALEDPDMSLAQMLWTVSTVIVTSYSYLRNLPVDYLKIDGVFVKDIMTNPSDYAVVKSINEIGHFMGKKTIAEYVEDDQVLEMLRDIGIDFAQGYGIEKKVPLTDLLTM
jgi:ABC-type phosphate transport system permease subunit